MDGSSDVIRIDEFPGGCLREIIDQVQAGPAEKGWRQHRFLWQSVFLNPPFTDLIADVDQHSVSQHKRNSISHPWRNEEVIGQVSPTGLLARLCQTLLLNLRKQHQS